MMRTESSNQLFAWQQCPGHQAPHCAVDNAVSRAPPSPPLGLCLARSGCKWSRTNLCCRPGQVSGIRRCTLLVRRKSRGVSSADCQRMFCGPTPLAYWGSNARNAPVKHCRARDTPTLTFGRPQLLFVLVSDALVPLGHGSEMRP